MSNRAQLQEGTRRGVRPITMGVLVGTVVCAVLLLVFSVVLASRSVPQGLIGPMAIFALSIGAFSSGFCSARIARAKGLLFGAACGVIITVLVMTASMIGGSELGIPALLKTAFILFSSMIGGVLGVNARRRR